MADADLDLAAKAIRDSRVINTGQVCNCAERVYVQESVAEQFIAKVTPAMQATRFGDSLSEPGVDMGPLVSKQQLRDVEAAVEQAIKDGASLVLGGKKDGSTARVFLSAHGAHQLPAKNRHHAEGDLRAGSAHHHFQRPR